MNDHVGKINLDELYTRKKEVHDNKLKIYNMILKRVHDRIKYTSRLKDSQCFCCYVIPEFLLGVPRYDSAACTAYLIDQLKDNGFAIKYTHPNLLFISWNHYIPPSVRRDIKKRTGVSIDGFGNKKGSKKKKDDSNPNSLLLKDKGTTVANKKNNQNYKQVSDWKPMGGLIYNTDLIKKIETSTHPNNK